MTAMNYLAIRTFHETAVALSVSGFFVRGLAGLFDAGWMRGRAVKVLPHIVDTALLTSALMLVTMLHANPFALPWLVAKLTGLVIYIVLGAIALRPGIDKRWRAGAWASALLTVSWMISVAFTKSPLGYFAVL
jgi:uncharacterized membrane protein SirB2